MSAAVIVFIVCTAACAVAHLAILRSIIRTRNANLLREVVWALVPAVALAFVLTATWARIRERPASPPVIMRIAR
jgi:hypothetical protein